MNRPSVEQSSGTDRLGSVTQVSGKESVNMAVVERTTLRSTSEVAASQRQLGTISWKWMVTTDHKVIGNLYFITSVLFFMFGGILALGIRAELAFPGGLFTGEFVEV